jgi:dipeptidyl aminopeptidase/acylaminoacyl peptidase
MDYSVRRFLSAAVFAMLVVGSAVALAAERGLTAEDYFSFRFLSDPQFSPDGSTIAFVVTTVDQKQNRRYSAIWTVAADGSQEPKPLTTAPQSSTSPRWSPDNRAIAFLSARPVAGDAATDVPRNQVWLLSLSGGEPHRITNLQNGASAFVWSPDGTRLVCISRSGPSDKAKSPSDVRHYKHANYKFNDTGWFDDKRSHLWVVNVASGAASQVTSGDDWNDTDPQWSPDSQKIAFVSDRTGKAFDESHNTDVWVIDATGGAPTRISDHPEPDHSPRWSPDGKTIAYIGATEERAHPKIWLAPGGGRAASQLAVDGLDLIPTGLRWAEGGRALYFETGVKGETHLYRADLATRKAGPVTSGARTVRFVDVNEKTGRLVYAANDPTHIDDLYVADTKGQNERQLTHLNAALWKQVTLVPVERVAYKGADGWDIDGFLMKPVGWQPARTYPMVLTVHGGPAGMYGFDWQHEFQIYAARGWAVFFCNPRGSTGYGEKFERGLQGQWGNKDYIDVMNGVDALLTQNPWIDKDRLGVTGGSYGGYMTNWIVSHTNRFKAAVTLRGMSNFISTDGTRDGPYGHTADFGGDVFQAFDTYWNVSPLKYAKNVKTPILILHSDMDFRVPIEQGEQWFRALQHFGAPSEVVFFPRENHNLTRTGEPKHLVESLKWQVYWFDRYLNSNPEAVPPDAADTRTAAVTDDRR